MKYKSKEKKNEIKLEAFLNKNKTKKIRIFK